MMSYHAVTIVVCALCFNGAQSADNTAKLTLTADNMEKDMSPLFASLKNLQQAATPQMQDLAGKVLPLMQGAIDNISRVMATDQKLLGTDLSTPLNIQLQNITDSLLEEQSFLQNVKNGVGVDEDCVKTEMTKFMSDLEEKVDRLVTNVARGLAKLASKVNLNDKDKLPGFINTLLISVLSAALVATGTAASTIAAKVAQYTKAITTALS